jgi:adenosylmethionine-8-amino-7-oxononanoate aminotransferase
MTNTHHLEQYLIVAHGIVIPQDDDDNRYVDAGSNPTTTLVGHLHAQATNI